MPDKKQCRPKWVDIHMKGQEGLQKYLGGKNQNYCEMDQTCE